MPWVFLCLMLTNAAYFAWRFVGDQSAQTLQIKNDSPMAEGRPVVLLSERPDLHRRAEPNMLVEDAAAADDGRATPALEVLRQCYFIGPFPSDAAAKRFGALMNGKGFASRIETRKVEEKDFWVFIPPFTNREKAEERLRDLKSRGIEGFVVRDGAFVNSISLNHFSRKELAQSFLQQMQAAGVVVESREIKRSEAEFWTYLASGYSDKSLRSAIDDYFTDNNRLRRENAACEE